jgi:hypothetical protein
MRHARIALAGVVLAVITLTSCGKPAIPKPDNKQYRLGYQAGRRDERAALCEMVKRHEAAFSSVLGAARLAAIRAFCAARLQP